MYVNRRSETVICSRVGTRVPGWNSVYYWERFLHWFSIWMKIGPSDNLLLPATPMAFVYQTSSLKFSHNFFLNFKIFEIFIMIFLKFLSLTKNLTLFSPKFSRSMFVKLKKILIKYFQNFEKFDWKWYYYCPLYTAIKNTTRLYCTREGGQGEEFEMRRSGASG